MKKMTTLVATIATTLLLSGLALIAPSPALAATPTPGSDCGCPTTGAYHLPQGLETPYVGSDGSSAGSGAKYRVETQGTWPDVTVQVRRLSDAKVVLTANAVPANWGFSPDQDRFVTYGLLNGTYYVQLYDLTAANPGAGMWSTSTLSSENRIGFSPHSKYLVFTWLNNASSTVQHQVVSTATGREYDVQYSFYSAPGRGGDEFGSTGFGFSPDANDRGLFTTYVTGQTTVQDNLYDLSARAQTWTHERVGSGFVEFSPCGDVLGVVEQNGQTTDDVTLIRVSDGQQVATRGYPIGTIGLRATTTSHIVSVNGVDQTPALATNTAGATCADTQAPTWPAGAALSTSNVAKTSLTLTWPAATDDKAVSQYKVFKGTTLLATLGSSARTYNVTGLTQGTSYTFKVQAGDAAGNVSTDGPSVTVRTLSDAPAWPAGTTVVGKDVTETGATLLWGAASGAVASYRVYRDGTLVGTVPGTARSYAATGLAAGTSYLFKVEAVGSTGAESTTGPSVRVRTPGYTQLDRSEITGTIWWDDNSDQVQDPTEDVLDKSATPNIGVEAYRIVDGTAVASSIGAAVHADGTYTIDNATDGDYLVVLDIGDRGQSFPADYQPHRITVSGGHGVGAVDFGITDHARPAQGTGSGTISGTLTADGGGSLDGAGLHCYFTSLGSGCGSDSTAGADGTLNLTGLTAGTYELSPELQAHQWQTAPVDTDGHPLKHVVVVSSNGGGGAVGFTVLQGHSTVTGPVYDDLDADGTQDAGEDALTSLDGATVCLQRTDGSDAECTLADHGYSFAGLRPGDYEVRVTEEGGWHQTDPAGAPVLVHVESNGDTVQGGTLGAHQPRGVVQGVVWDDRDGDGKHDADEPGLAGIDVAVQRSGSEGWSYYPTDAQGHYATDLLAVDAYLVFIDRRGTWTQTYPAGGASQEVAVTDGGTEHADFGLNDGTVVPGETEPGAPVDLTATAGVEKVDLAWSAPADDGGSPVTGYVVQKSTDGTTWDDVATVIGTAYEVSALAGGEPVSFRVAAVNAVGRGAWTDVVTATPDRPVVAPSAPTALTATAGVEKVSLAWSAPADNGGADVTGYVVEKSTDGQVWTEVGTPTATSLDVTGLTAGTSVRFRVAAVNSAGQGAWSAEATATPLAKPAVVVPSAPTGLTATVSSSRRTIKLGWHAPASDGGAPVTDYVVQVSVFPLFGWYVLNDGVSTNPTATITSPLPGLKLYYRVAARNSAGLGAWSTPVRAG